MLRGILPIALVVAVAVLMYTVIGPFAGAYPSRIMLDAGIAIIMAVSLNIVNGYTGQFSIGHAAFMAIGGYAAGFFTYYTSLAIWAPRPWMLPCAAIAGGLVAAGAG